MASHKVILLKRPCTNELLILFLLHFYVIEYIGIVTRTIKVDGKGEYYKKNSNGHQQLPKSFNFAITNPT